MNGEIDERYEVKEESLKLSVEESFKLREGLHEGKITEVHRNITTNKETGEKYDYVNITILPDEMDFAVSVGFPARITPKTGLGNLIKKFTDIETGKSIDVKKLLLNKRISFMTTNTEEGYVNIVKETIKPIRTHDNL